MHVALGVTLHKRFAIFLRGNNTIAKLFSTQYRSHLDYHNFSFLCFVAPRKEVTNTEREPAKRWPSWPNHETQQHQLLKNENNRIFFFTLLVYCLVFCNVLHPCLDDGHGELGDDVKVVEMLSHMQWSKWVLKMNFSSVVKMGTNNNNGD